MDSLNLRQRILLNQPHIESVSGDIANFITNMKAPLKECKVYFNPIQEGEGDPSPDNIKNISGWTGVNINRTGKNLLNPSLLKDQETWNIIEMELPVGTRLIMSTNKPSTSYTGGMFLFFRNSDVDTLSSADSVYNNQSVIHTVNNTGKIQIVQRNRDNTDSFKNYWYQLELMPSGSTPTEYKPYQGTTISIDWSDKVGTVYGGYIDLINGELVEKYNFINIDYSKPWGATTNYLYRYDNLPSSIGGRNMYVKTLCSHRINPYDVTAAVTVGAQGYISVGKKFCEMVGIEMTSDAFNQYLVEQNNNGTPLEICYLLATPIHYQLTPQQLLTFKGENNIWSDTNGQTEVKFWTH